MIYISLYNEKWKPRLFLNVDSSNAINSPPSLTSWADSTRPLFISFINDLVDLEADRRHPRKKLRALASGQLPVRMGVIAAILIPVLSLGAAILLRPQFAVALIVYFLLHVLYSFALKNIVIIDILTKWVDEVMSGK